MSQENNCAGVSFNKVSGWKLATLFKERLWHIFFPVNVEEFSKGLVKPIQHFIQHKKMPCWMKCWTGLTEHRNNKKEKIMLDEEKSCWMKTWLWPNFSFNIFRLNQQNLLVKAGANQSKNFIQHFFRMFDEMLDEKLRVSYDEFSGLHTFIQHSIQHSNVHSFINSNSK